MSKKDVDAAFEALQDYATKAQNAAYAAAGQVDATLSQVSQGARAGTAFVITESGRLRSQGEDIVTTGTAHMSAARDEGVAVVRESVKEGLRWAKEYPYAAYGLAASTLLLFPAPRSYLMRNVFGFMQSQESLFRSATEHSKSLKASMEMLLKEKADLTDSAAAAMQDLKAARERASASKAALTNLSSRMASTISPVKDVVVKLRSVDAKEAIALRTDLARDLAELSAHQKSLDVAIAQMASV